MRLTGGDGSWSCENEGMDDKSMSAVNVTLKRGDIIEVSFLKVS
jgi:hypothetical protein